jgi:hypothetical protein
LHQDLDEMMLRRYSPNDFEFDQPIIMSHRAQHQYGTVVAGLCWLTHVPRGGSLGAGTACEGGGDASP